jgi:hypothetical protein
MKLTNRFGYPETIAKAIERDPYSRGDSEFSATSLISPPRKRVLEARHRDELTEDVDDGIWRLFGHLGHALLERAGTGLNAVVEKRFFGVVADTKISAQIDSLSLEPDGTLVDWKFTSVYGFKPGVPPKREYIAQMNIQRYLIPPEFEIKRMQIWGILRDWRPGEAAKGGKSYPNKLGFHDIPMFSKEATERFITERIAMHRAADKELPLCDKEDTWGWRRCSGGYCNVSKYCKQYQDYLQSKKTSL